MKDSRNLNGEWAIQLVGRGQGLRQRQALTAYNQMVLGALPAAVRRIGAGERAPFFRRHAEGVNGGAAPVNAALLSQFVQQGLLERLHGAGQRPVSQPPPAGHSADAEHFPRKPFPGNACPENEDDSAQTSPVIPWGRPPLGRGRCTGNRGATRLQMASGTSSRPIPAA